MGAAQITIVALLCLSLGCSLALHGKPRLPHNFGAALLSAALWVGILYWGGFWGTA